MNHTMESCYPVFVIQIHFPIRLWSIRNETQAFCTADKKPGIFQITRTNAINKCFKLLNYYILQFLKFFPY